VESRKNLLRLIKAFNTVRAREGGGLQLVLAGRMGHGSDRVSQAIGDLGLDGPVVMTGYVMNEEKQALLAGAVAFAYPSLYEGFGIPVLEAMAMGVPVLASAGSALSEAADGAAVTVDPTSEEQLADGLGRIVRDRSLRRRLVDAGLERAGSFTPGAMARAMIDVYRKLV
jgi:glycosyltransferase involved in cell wall biosynthesis